MRHTSDSAVLVSLYLLSWATALCESRRDQPVVHGSCSQWCSLSFGFQGSGDVGVTGMVVALK